jgi:type IV pilus assembly protein PilX
MRTIRHAQQRGVVLIIALIVMVSMALAAIALVRTVDTGLLAAANLAFRQNATMAGDNGLRAATDWLVGANASNLFDNQAGYWANAQSGVNGFDPLNYDWTGANNSVCAFNCTPDAGGNTVRYVIHRLCDTSGNPLSINCMRAPTSNAGTTGQSAVDYRHLYSTSSAAGSGNLGGTYYRVTARVSGPRNTTSYVQAVLF